MIFPFFYSFPIVFLWFFEPAIEPWHGNPENLDETWLNISIYSWQKRIREVFSGSSVNWNDVIIYFHVPIQYVCMYIYIYYIHIYYVYLYIYICIYIIYIYLLLNIHQSTCHDRRYLSIYLSSVGIISMTTLAQHILPVSAQVGSELSETKNHELELAKSQSWFFSCKKALLGGRWHHSPCILSCFTMFNCHLDIPSGSQAWQWTISMNGGFNRKTTYYCQFSSLPCLIIRRYIIIFLWFSCDFPIFL